MAQGDSPVCGAGLSWRGSGVGTGIQLHRRAIAADRAQSEFVDSYERYLRRVSPRRIERGRELMQTHGQMMGRVAEGYGVQPRFIAAILGLESDYGTFPIAEPPLSPSKSIPASPPASN